MLSSANCFTSSCSLPNATVCTSTRIISHHALYLVRELYTCLYVLYSTETGMRMNNSEMYLFWVSLEIRPEACKQVLTDQIFFLQIMWTTWELGRCHLSIRNICRVLVEYFHEQLLPLQCFLKHPYECGVSTSQYPGTNLQRV